MDNLFDNITLTDEEGNDVEFEVITKLDIEEDEYFIVAPVDDEEGEAIALKVIKDENGEEFFTTVEDEEEFNIVNDAFETLCAEGVIE